MTWAPFLPAAATVTLGILLGRGPLPLHPMWSARLLATVSLTTALTLTGTFWFVALNYLAGLAPDQADELVPEWALFGDDAPLPAAVGVAAIVLTGITLTTALRLSIRWVWDVRRAQHRAHHPIDTDVPVAMAIPGRNGGVLVSRGLLESLTSTELHVVFQHERAHLRHGHHRYLAVGALVAALLPPLRCLERRLQFAIERWADEDAARAVSDRALVARTIARVALAHQPGPTTAPGFTDSGVVQRVKALLDTPPGKNPVIGPVTVLCTRIVTSCFTLAALQLDQAMGIHWI